MKVFPFEIINAESWIDSNKTNYLPRMIRLAYGEDYRKLNNIIELINDANSETAISIGKRVGVYINNKVKVWWKLTESSSLGIKIKYDAELACKKSFPRAGFKVLGTNVNGPHNENGPAIEHKDGSIYYYIDGVLHREDGPAVIFPSGSEEWYIEGNKLDESEIEIRKLHLMGFDDLDIKVLDDLDLI